MTISNIVEINRVLERDRTDTTYKFALLRGAADIAQQHNPYTAEGRVWYKTGLMVEKWLEYYYPLFDSDVFIPQKNGEMPLSHDGKNVSFRRKFKRLTDYYSSRGGFNAFWTQYKNGTIDEEINDACLNLVKDIWRTITYYPMKHLGYSIKNEHYSYFGYVRENLYDQALLSLVNCWLTGSGISGWTETSGGDILGLYSFKEEYDTKINIAVTKDSLALDDEIIKIPLWLFLLLC